MIHNLWKLTFAASILAPMAFTSCNKDMYDEEQYRRYVDLVSPVDTVDTTHTWKLATVHLLRVTANAQSNAQNLLILSADPTTQNADLLAKTDISDGQTVNISFSAPTLSTEFYAALHNADGTYTITSFPDTQSELNFTPQTGTTTNVYTKLTPQTFTYCFDAAFPLPEDYDFNDAVLRISLERTGEKQLSISVTLAAVGCDKQIAAAIRLVGYEYTDIESITAVDGKAFNNDIPSQSYSIIGSNELLVSGRKREAVLNLFEDAHWAMGDRLSASFGIFTRKMYNVSSGTGDDYQQMAPRTCTYLINFKDGSRLNDFTFESLDPFIIEDYNGSFWEVHTYQHMMAQTKYEYPASDIKNLPWALEIPNGTFRYPYQGINMGFIKNGVTFGAYMTVDHSFGQWAEDHTKSTDWYFYPTGNMVY